jgi:hypothetical protein
VDESEKKARENLTPYYLSTPLFSEVCIGLRKWTRTKKSTMSRKWARVRRGDDMMLGSIYETLLCDGIVPPEDKNNSFSLFRECSDSPISKTFPSFACMTCRLSLPDREYGIQEKYSLLCPIREIGFYPTHSDI